MSRLAVGFALSVLALSTPTWAWSDSGTPDRTSANPTAKVAPVQGVTRSRAVPSRSRAPAATSADRQRPAVAHGRRRPPAKAPARSDAAFQANAAADRKRGRPAAPLARHDIPGMQHATTPEMDMGEVEMEEKGHVGSVPAVQRPGRR